MVDRESKNPLSILDMDELRDRHMLFSFYPETATELSFLPHIREHLLHSRS